MDNSTVERQFEDYFDMFSREGWKLFMDDMKDILEGIDSLEYVKNYDDFLHRKGQLEILKRIVGFENGIEAAYKEFKDAETL